ncbi:MAG: hypothetical protein P4M11_03575 [Candidatus Pacebacteria bacterium]|nr:hypothetical protein [Candidatus Paceibacterota bacterium]
MRTWRSQAFSRAASLAATYSASVEESEMVCCLREDQETGQPLTKTMKPVVDCVVSLSPAQSASQ